jgi:carboxymethylenebutenolidase
MSGDIDITASDSHRLGAYLAEPGARPRGALVVIQEAFGVNDYVRSVCDRYAAEGYLAIAPALYDRQRRDATFGYEKTDMDAARQLRAGLVWADVLKDVDAAVNEVTSAGKVGIVGYCVGGSVAWLAAQHLNIAAAVSYYGRDIVGMRDRPPRCPTMLLFAERDAHIPLGDVETIRTTFPELPIYVLPGEHGFDCDKRASFEPTSARIGRDRTLALFRKYVG